MSRLAAFVKILKHNRRNWRDHLEPLNQGRLMIYERGVDITNAEAASLKEYCQHQVVIKTLSQNILKRSRLSAPSAHAQWREGRLCDQWRRRDDGKYIFATR
jgi:hypothetical protein